LSNAQAELKVSKPRLRGMEKQAAQLNRAMDGFREEIQLKPAQHASAQSLMNSMRDQISEMAMQTKTARERCESLEAELADVHHLLSEPRRRDDEAVAERYVPMPR
jgi:chromosome segregation ATPase